MKEEVSTEHLEWFLVQARCYENVCEEEACMRLSF